jgi:hypothetical protein
MVEGSQRVPFVPVQAPGGEPAQPVHEGDLSALPLTDLVRSLSRTGACYRIEVWEHGQLVGQIWLGGTVTACQAAGRTDEEAFFRLAEVLAGRFRVFRDGLPRQTEAGLVTRLDELLEIAGWHRQRAGARPWPPVPGHAGARAAAAAERVRLVPIPADDPRCQFETLLHTAMAACFKRDYHRARALLERCRELRPADRRIRFGLDSLRRREEAR